ncbi:B-box type zinc finger protein ncl-1-like isoform X1 [Centruroides sculpturatus]|uniref:B-box type zinc finger protein ncl-1-like isoform X1 n=2 Tax=Centruroides sculpturatus TaxID=218467 RepID=UPI000C6E7E0B|nr:B-box type zinc finger protein ncl-1-like isoform X1 [Centruroides sculpturatus]
MSNEAIKMSSSPISSVRPTSMASPTPSLQESLLLGASPLSFIGDHNQPESDVPTKCNICHEIFTLPKVLPCFHTFCQHCLEKIQESTEKIKCPQCQQECSLPVQGVAGLLSDYAVSNILEMAAIEGTSLCCTGCKSKESNAVARCFDCANFLCPNCVMAHQFMHCFEGHHVLTLSELQNKDDLKVEKPVACLRHKNELLKYFCKTCNIPICKECTILEHPKSLHDYDNLIDVSQKQIELISQMIEDSKLKTNDLRNAAKTVEHFSSRLQMQYHKAQNEVNETFQFYRSMLEERKQETQKELDNMYNTKIVSLSLLGQKIQEMIDKIHRMCEFVDRITKFSSNTEILVFKQLLDSTLQHILAFNPEVNLQSFDLEFVSNYQAIQVGVRNTFGYVRHNAEVASHTSKPPPIARPNGTIGSERTYHQNGHIFESSILSKRFNSANSLGPFSTSLTDLSPYEKWSSGTGDIFQNGTTETYSLTDPLIDISPKFISTNIYPLKSQIKRQKMIYHCKFGEFGVMEGQFTEPSGVAVNAQNDIIVADTNNHRIQIFDKEGRFKFQFGECGKRDGQLLYPNRVAVVKTSGDIIVTERSPTHQIQIYNQYGQFVRKFGANILQHPRGVTVDIKGRIIVVECKVMRVIIFDQMGNVLQKFGCSKHLEFPNGVVVNDKQEIFISDNRAHCVKVFNYDGSFLRQIGGEGLTNYPIGVCINQNGEILVADNHNNFNITIFTQDGQLVNALESKVKHAQCFDVALMDDGSVVLASKDYRLYVYCYVQVHGIGP